MSGMVKTVGKVMGKLLGFEPPQMPQMQAPQIVMPPPVQAPPASQAAGQPDQSEVRGDRARRAASGGAPSSTMLTGPGGIDPSTLSIGKGSLLGM